MDKQAVEEIIENSNIMIVNFLHNSYENGLIAESENKYVEAYNHYMCCVNLVKLDIRGIDVDEYDTDLNRAEKLIITTKDFESPASISDLPVPFPNPNDNIALFTQ